MEPGYEIYEYSRRGMLTDLRDALKSGVGPDLYQAYDGSTALVMAARSGKGACMLELLSHGADKHVRTEEGSTLLGHAVSGGSTEAVKVAVEAGISVNEANEDGVTPLMLAAHYRFHRIVDLLCNAGANVNAEADGWGTALDSAEGDSADMLKKHGAKHSAGGLDQPMAAASERFNYGCFESGQNFNARPDAAPAATKEATAPLLEQRPAVGDYVTLRKPKTGLLKEGDVGTVVADDGSDCVPLKVKLGESFDYYDYADVKICPAAVDLPPDGDRANPEGTMRYLTSKLNKAVVPAELGSTGLRVSPVGFGCHRIEDTDIHKDALRLAVQLGCNFIDVAPNYTNGDAELVVGSVLKELIDCKKVRRDEMVVATKVGNVLGKQLAFAEDVAGMTVISDNLRHCISPGWIEQELTRSLERLQLSCIDILFLHCPEFEAKTQDVDMVCVYARLKEAFRHLESEVARGRIAGYGISGAFQPLRPTDPQHLDLHAVMAQLPEEHHFRVIQLPLNFAEAPTHWVAHTPRNADGAALDSEAAQTAASLFEAAKEHKVATMINRPLDGIYKETHGVLRFSSLDSNVRSFSELQLDNCDVLEQKLTSMCKLNADPYHMGEGAEGKLASKTVKLLAGLEGVDCVLLGMRRPEYVVGTLPLAFGTPPLPPQVASAALRGLHNTISMWFATAIHEADHGTSKHWRLPVQEKYDTAVGA